MNYNSYAFWALFLVVYVVFWRLDHKRQNMWLLLASYVFYGTWDYRFLFLVLLSTVIDYIGGLGVAGIQLRRGVGWRIGSLLVGSSLVLCSNVQWGALLLALRGSGSIAASLPRSASDFLIPAGTLASVLVYGAFLPRLYALPEQSRRKWFLIISMVANLAILGFFKYCDFFIQSAVDLLSTLGFQPHIGTLGLILPAGISFYTFQAMSYTIDIYRRDAEPTSDFADFALFVCFFPHLVAGPIMRAHTLLPQVVNKRPDPRGTNAMMEGAVLVLVGLFKKIVIADNLAPLVNFAFSRSEHGEVGSGAEALLGVYAFAFQIYGDFSGYSAIARGISKWLGFELALNFDLPYIATSPSDFWRRWHISLSSWLRDYLYIPLGGNRNGRGAEYRNLVITMLLGGLWHGASWHFVAWGAYHGLILCIFRLAGIKDPAFAKEPVRWWLRVVAMFHLTCLGWLFFRADSISGAFVMLQRIFFDFAGPADVLAPLAAEVVLFGVIPCVLDFWLRGERELSRLWAARWWIQAPVYSFILLMILFFRPGVSGEFIYFQF